MTAPTPPPPRGEAPPVVNLKFPLSPYMSRREVADWLRIHPNSVDKLGRDGILRRHRIEGLDVLVYLRKEVEGIVVEEDQHPESNAVRARVRNARKRAGQTKRRTAP